MLTQDQIANLTVGQEIAHTYIPRGKKRPVSSHYKIIAINPPDDIGKLHLGLPNKTTGKVISGFTFVYSITDETLSLPTDQTRKQDKR